MVYIESVPRPLMSADACDRAVEAVAKPVAQEGDRDDEAGHGRQAE
jgi:hypothetical protein